MEKRAPSLRDLKRFSITVAVGLALIGGLSWYRGHTTIPRVFWATAGVLAAVGFVAPRALRPVERAWMRLALLLAWVNTRVILSVLFYAVVAPMGWILRRFHDPLDRRLPDERASYWKRRDATPCDPKLYQNQF